jgi:hypothetical protein
MSVHRKGEGKYIALNGYGLCAPCFKLGMSGHLTGPPLPRPKTPASLILSESEL